MIPAQERVAREQDGYEQVLIQPGYVNAYVVPLAGGGTQTGRETLRHGTTATSSDIIYHLQQQLSYDAHVTSLIFMLVFLTPSIHSELFGSTVSPCVRPSEKRPRHELDSDDHSRKSTTLRELQRIVPRFLCSTSVPGTRKAGSLAEKMVALGAARTVYQNN